MFQHLNHRGARRRRGRTRNWKLIWKTSEGELSQYGKGNRHAIQEAQRVQKKLHPRKHITRHIIIILPKVKDKKRILKAAREKERVTYKGVPIRLSANFSKETLQARRGWKEVFKVTKSKGPASKITLSSKALIYNGRAGKLLPR